jgi:hypothetical protein
MKRLFRIITFRDGGFWTEPSYMVAKNSKAVRAALARDAGPEVAAKSCVTAIANTGADAGIL